MEIHLTAELEEFVGQQVDSGQFASPEEVVAAALSFLRAQQEADHASIQRGIEEAEAGLGSPVNEVRDRLTNRYT